MIVITYFKSTGVIKQIMRNLPDDTDISGYSPPDACAVLVVDQWPDGLALLDSVVDITGDSPALKPKQG